MTMSPTLALVSQLMDAITRLPFVIAVLTKGTVLVLLAIGLTRLLTPAISFGVCRSPACFCCPPARLSHGSSSCACWPPRATQSPGNRRRARFGASARQPRSHRKQRARATRVRSSL
jgi:hypothetical protein